MFPLGLRRLGLCGVPGPPGVFLILLFPFVALFFSLLFWKKERASLLSWLSRKRSWGGLATPKTLYSSVTSAYVMILTVLLYLGRSPYDSSPAGTGGR